MSVALKKNQEEIIASFNKLRNEQRTIAGKLSEVQMDLSEHKMVIDTLDGVDGDKKCFRMIGGVLVERTVQEVAPALTHNKQKLEKLVETLEKQLTSKGSEINAFAEKHNIQVRGGGSAANAGNVAAQAGKEEAENKKNAKGSSGGILVQDGEKS